MRGEPEPIYDRRDVIGTLPACPDVDAVDVRGAAPRAQRVEWVEMPRDLAERALRALVDTLTPAGHLA